MTQQAQQTALSGGFADVARDAANAFRPLLQAMARPGEIRPIRGATGPAPLSEAAATVIATLCDPDTPLWLAPSVDQPAIREWIAFQTGAPLVAPERARFALGRWEEFSLDAFATGTPDYPDRSATLIVELERLNNTGARLTGPGIADEAVLNLPERAAFQANHALFPLGLDFIFTCGQRVAALPRSTQVS